MYTPIARVCGYITVVFSARAKNHVAGYVWTITTMARIGNPLFICGCTLLIYWHLAKALPQEGKLIAS